MPKWNSGIEFGSNNVNSLGSKRSIKTNISKNSCFHDDKSSRPISRPNIECDKPQGTNHKGPQAILTITVELIGACFCDLRGCWNLIFLEKKAIFPVKKLFWPSFSRSIERDKGQGTIYKGPAGNLTGIVPATWLVLQDLRSREPNFSKTVFLPGEKKSLALFFSCYRMWQASRDSLYDSKAKSDNYSGSYKIIL